MCRLICIFMFLIFSSACLVPSYAAETKPAATASKPQAKKTAPKKSEKKKAASKKTSQKTAKNSPPKVVLIGRDPKYASIVMDADTGIILQQDSPDKVVYPASLTKMMTLMVTFDALQQGRVTLHDQVNISSYAHSMAPSKLNLPVGSSIRLDQAIGAIVTKSANDIAVAVAEHVGGTHGTFVSMMNRKAVAIGMNSTYFTNACGLHNAKQVTTARDMARLGRALIYDYPRYYRYFSMQNFSYKGNIYANHNHLMETYRGMDGIKTGYIVPSGFNLVASAKRGDRRLIGVVFGGRSAKSRDAQMASLLDSGFARPSTVAVANAAPAQKPVVAATNTATGDAARWGELAPMLQNKAVANVIGQGDIDPIVISRLDPSRSSADSVPAKPDAPMLTSPAALPKGSETRDWSIQIGAFNSRVKTDEALQAAQRNLSPALGHGVAMIAPLQTTQGWVFRGRLGGFTKQEAAQACGALSHCIAVSPNATQN